MCGNEPRTHAALHTGAVAVRGIPRRGRDRPPRSPPPRRASPPLVDDPVPRRRGGHRLPIAEQLRLPPPVDVQITGTATVRRRGREARHEHPFRQRGQAATSLVEIPGHWQSSGRPRDGVEALQRIDAREHDTLRLSRRKVLLRRGRPQELAAGGEGGHGEGSGLRHRGRVR